MCVPVFMCALCRRTSKSQLPKPRLSFVLCVATLYELCTAIRERGRPGRLMTSYWTGEGSSSALHHALRSSAWAVMGGSCPEALSPTITHMRHEFLQVLIVQAGVQGFFSSATFLEKHISYVILAKGHPFIFAESAFVLPEGLEVGSNLAKGRDPFRSRVTWIMSFKNDLHKTTFFLAHQPRQS